MNKAERLDNPGIQFVVNADRAAIHERASSRLSRILNRRRKWIVLFVLLAIVVVLGAIAISPIDTREFFPIHLDFESRPWS